jgi:signal transduction histidine kinase
VHPDDIARAETAMRAAAANETGAEIEYRIVTPDGIRWMNRRAQLFRDKNSTAVRMIGTDMDVTERRVLEDELRVITRTLETRVQEEVAARQAAQARAAHSERLQALGQLAGGIAHDFNNVLQAVSGALRLIARRPGDEPGVLRIAQLAIEATERGAAITRRLLAFGRRADLRAEAIDPAPLLRDLREILVHTLGVEIEVRVDASHELPPLLADRSQLETSLINLATNARDAMPDGGTLTFAAVQEIVPHAAAPSPDERHRTHPAGLVPGRYIRLSVEDTGTGMDAATLARASEPFFTTKKDGVGTGLGLAMTKGFTEQSGGGIRVESSPGAGTTITLWFPEATSEATGGAGAEVGRDGRAPAAGEADRPRILLVDDDAAVRHVLAIELADGGYAVTPATSGTEALALLDDGETFAALVTDLSMPEIDGLTLIRAAQERRPGLPAVLLTGYAGDGASLAVGGALSGTFTLLRKPVSGVQLTDRLSSLLMERA